MGKYDRVERETGWGLPYRSCRDLDAEAIDELLELTRADDAEYRLVALMNLCPCNVRSNVPAAWDRIIEMRHDPDPRVRSLVAHNLTDGSPREREWEVRAALDDMRNDRDRKVRRRVNEYLGRMRRSGRVNVG